METMPTNTETKKDIFTKIDARVVALPFAALDDNGESIPGTFILYGSSSDEALQNLINLIETRNADHPIKYDIVPVTLHLETEKIVDTLKEIEAEHAK